MRDSDRLAQTHRIVDQQSAYRAMWSRISKARQQQGKDRLSFAVKARPQAAGLSLDRVWLSIFAAGLRAQGSGRATLIAALQAGQARASQAEKAARLMSAGGIVPCRPVGTVSLGAILVRAQAAGHTLAGKAAGHVQARQQGARLRGGRSRGQEAKSMHPAGDIARLTTPKRTAPLQAVAVFYACAEGDTDYSASKGRLLRSEPVAGLWTTRVAGKSEVRQGKRANYDAMREQYTDVRDAE